MPLCSPLESSKWPCRMAPAASNIFNNSVRFSMGPATRRLLLTIETSAA
jgi:hypothetical protein